jgi:hypothetical protein
MRVLNPILFFLVILYAIAGLNLFRGSAKREGDHRKNQTDIGGF